MALPLLIILIMNIGLDMIWDFAPAEAVKGVAAFLADCTEPVHLTFNW